jgi:hypothetical protein
VTVYFGGQTSPISSHAVPKLIDLDWLMFMDGLGLMHLDRVGPVSDPFHLSCRVTVSWCLVALGSHYHGCIVAAMAY